jgi:hypothetical protein
MNLFTNSLIPALFLASAGFSGATTINQVGTYNFWPTTWTPLGSSTYDDIDSGFDAKYDFVGDVSNPGIYYAGSTDYVFFSARVNADTFSTSSGSFLLLIDVTADPVPKTPGSPFTGVSGIDYAFVWDDKGTPVADHQMEMGVTATNGPTWGQAQVTDLDGQPSDKTTVDINGLISGTTYRTTDGYVRTRDSQSTTYFGPTTLIDFAVKWSYLEANTKLNPAQTWKVTMASIVNATDHNAFNGDVAGAALADNITTGWSSGFAPVPEPGSALAGFLLAAGLLRRRR